MLIVFFLMEAFYVLVMYVIDFSLSITKFYSPHASLAMGLFFLAFMTVITLVVLLKIEKVKN